MNKNELIINWPVAGDILNRHDGVVKSGNLVINVNGEAPASDQVNISCYSGDTLLSSTAAARCGTHFNAEVTLSEQRHSIVVTAGNEQSVLPVMYDKNSQLRYRFSIDDNILFLKDLAQGDYQSLFDHWYLSFWRDVHRQYGTKVHMNIYYQTDESVFPGGFFQLPQMPERFKDEWQNNSDWLHLTFHAWQNKPDRPYRDVSYEQMRHDYLAVTGQIKRFAGEEVLSNFTTVHWAEATREGVRALRDCGMKGLIGLFAQRKATAYTKYYLDDATADHVMERDYWWDAAMDMIYVSCDAVVNGYSLDKVVPRMEEIGSSPHTSEAIELLIHEQYFRPELSIYQDDVKQKVLNAVEWVSQRGYKPVFWGDGFIGA